MKAKFNHYRIPESQVHKINPGHAKPRTRNLWRYSRKNGWLSEVIKDDEPFARGGLTICYLYDDEGKFLAKAISTCSWLDTFSYRIGRQISMGRAIKKVEDHNGSASV